MGQQGSKGANASIADPNAPTMKAWVATSASHSPTNLNNVALLTNVPVPVPTKSQVRVKIYSASLNRVDIGRATSPACVFPAILGTDGAGIVDQLGDESVANSQFHIYIGDRVYFHLETAGTSGTFAEYCVVELSCLTKIDPNATVEGASRRGSISEEPSSTATVPTTTGALAAAAGSSSSAGGASVTSGSIHPPIMSFAEAATMPSAAWTAFIALFDKLKIEHGRVIFIDGAAGGVGSYAVQLCKMMGLFVIGTCSTYNVEYLKSLGVDVVVDYVMDDVPDKLREWTQSRGVDYFLELVSPEQGDRFAKHIRFGGALCLVGGTFRNSQNSELLFLNQISVHHVNLNGMHRDQITWPLLNYLGTQCVQMVEAKTLRPCYNEVIPMEQCKAALTQLANGHAKGKIVIRIVDPVATRRQRPAPPPPILKPQSPDATAGPSVIADA